MSKAPLDPAFARAVAEFESYEADWIDGRPEDLRRAYDAARGLLSGDVVPGCSIEAFEADDVAGLTFQPETRRERTTAIVYFHGGSWMVGSPDTHRVPCSHLAHATGLSVFSISYRLAPEHPFPSQREDGVRAVAAVLDKGFEHVVLAGDSAGAAIAFWTDAALPPAAREKVAGVVGFYGAYGLIPEDGGVDDGTVLSTPEILATYQRLGPLAELRGTPDFTIAETAPLDGCPCYLSVGDADPLATDSMVLAKRLGAGGRSVTLDLVEGLGHSFVHHVVRVAKAREALTDAARWIGLL